MLTSSPMPVTFANLGSTMRDPHMHLTCLDSGVLLACCADTFTVLVLAVGDCASVVLLCVALGVTRGHSWRRCPECAVW